MKRFCCFSFKDFGRGGKCRVDEPIIRKSKDPSVPLIVDEDPMDSSSKVDVSPVMVKENLIHRLSFGSSEPASVSCPHLLIESKSEDPSSSLYPQNRNNLSVRYHGASRPSNTFLSKTSSFKRMMSFKSSKREIEGGKNFQLNFLGQIYRKKSCCQSSHSGTFYNKSEHSSNADSLNNQDVV